MNIFLRQKVELKYDGQYLLLTNISKDIDSDFIPRKGDFIDDLLYGAQNFIGEVERVVIDYSEKACYIDMKDLIIDVKELAIERRVIIPNEDKKTILKFWNEVCKSYRWKDQFENLYEDNTYSFDGLIK